MAWPQYVERFEYFFVANGITDAGKKRAVLLSVMGAATYKTSRNILSPVKPGEKTYAELVEKLTTHFKPAPSEIVERFKFHSRVRKAGESVSAYLAELRSLSEHCNFGESLNDMLRDRLVCGINDSAIQKTLLAKAALTFEAATEIALTAEATTQSMRELGLRSEGSSLSSRTAPQDVHRTIAGGTSSQAQDASKSTLICYRCGLAGHTSSRCKTRKDIVCHHCGKRGHMKRACKSRGKQNPPKRKGSTNTVRHLEDEEVEEGEGFRSDSQTSALFQVNSKGIPNAPPIKVKVKLDDCLVDMEVDMEVDTEHPSR